jgi:hypothetical protein
MTTSKGMDMVLALPADQRTRAERYWLPNGTTNATFIINTTWTTAADAERSCNVHGGHLGFYTSLAEQLEVEQWARDEVGGSRGQAWCVAVC